MGTEIDTKSRNSQFRVFLFLGFYRPQRSWGKVIFSEVCVKNSVHGGGGCMAGGMHGRGCMAGGMHGRRVCMVVGHAWQTGRAWQGCVCGRRDMCGRGHAWQGACMAGGMHDRGHA